MPGGWSYRRPLEQFFQGKKGQGPYANVIVSGSEGGRQVQLTAVSGLYADRQVTSLPMASGVTAPSKSELRRILRGYRFDPGDNVEAQILMLHPDPNEQERFLWDLAAHSVGSSMPLAMLSFMTALEGSDEQIAFWYTTLVPGEWLLDKFRAALGIR